MMKVSLLFLIISWIALATIQHEFDGCEKGWLRFKDFKCVIALDIGATYKESAEYCKTSFGAELLTIGTEEEQLFWSFQLIRHMKIGSNIWLNTNSNKTLSQSELDDSCMVLTSINETNHTIGSISTQVCKSLGATVCEIRANKPVTSKAVAKEYNVNEDVVPIERINFANGTRSDLFSGVYYVLISKFNNKTFSNEIFCDGKCLINNKVETHCAATNKDEDLSDKTSNYYMFILEENNLVQIRKFDSKKIMVFDSNHYLLNFISFEDGLTKDGKIVTQENLNTLKKVSTWRINQHRDSNYFVISSSHQNFTLGAVEYKNGENISLAFGLYDAVDLESKLDDKLLFQIVELNYTLDVQIHSIEFDGSLDKIMEENKKQISIIDTATIINNSPATLTHEISSTKEIIQTFETSYGVSQNFLESFTSSVEQGTSTSQSKSSSKSFTDIASQSVTTTLTDTISQSNTDSSESHSSTSNKVGAKAKTSFWGIGVEASASHSWDSGSSNSQTAVKSNENTKSETKGQDASHSKSSSEDNTNSKRTDHVETDVKQQEKQTRTDIQTSEGVSRSKSYSIHKTVSLPPYTSVKISSYANWIDDLTIKYNLTLKFSARSFRRLTNGEGTNYWRTLDKEFVEYLLKRHKFPGEILENNGFDYMYGQVTGFMKASVGLDSVFIASETKLNQII